MFGIHRLYAIQDNSNPSSLGTDQVLDLVGKSSKSSSSILLKGSSSSGGSNSSGHNATAPRVAMLPLAQPTNLLWLQWLEAVI